MNALSFLVVAPSACDVIVLGWSWSDLGTPPKIHRNLKMMDFPFPGRVYSQVPYFNLPRCIWGHGWDFPLDKSFKSEAILKPKRSNS